PSQLTLAGLPVAWSRLRPRLQWRGPCRLHTSFPRLPWSDCVEAMAGAPLAVNRGYALGVSLAALFAAAPARAADPFEIQVYDGTANAPRRFGLELHLNGYAAGPPAQGPPVLGLRRQLHATLEPSFGLFPWWEIGAY